MSKLRVLSFAVSLDGFSADTDQSLEYPLGEALFAGLDLDALGYECTGMQPGERAVHMRLRKRTD